MSLHDDLGLEPPLAFAPQHLLVQQLLDAAEAALPSLPPEEQNRLCRALRAFEEFSVAVLWSASDVRAVAPGLTEDEAREAVGIYVDNHECTDSDWEQIRAAVTAAGGDLTTEKQP